jgi:hypothetical protein
MAAAASGAAVLDYVAAFGLLHLSVAGDHAQADWLFRELFLPNVAIRCAVLLGCAAWSFADAFGIRWARSRQQTRSGAFPSHP